MKSFIPARHRTRFVFSSALLPSALLATFSAFSALPARADSPTSDQSNSLGGPLVEPRSNHTAPPAPKVVATKVVSTKVAVTKTAKAKTSTTPTRWAQATEAAPAVKPPEDVPLGGDNTHEVSTPATAQGALSIDLSQVKRIEVAGKVLDEAPMRVGNMDVLAPIVGEGSSILSGLGATASRASLNNLPGNPNTPTESQSFQINLPQGSPIVLTVGKAVAYVDRQEQQLRAAPLVIGGKIWLPIFSLAPMLGAAARLDPSDGTLHINPTVQSVELFPAKGYTVLTIKTSAPLADGRVLMGKMDNPDKVYFDFLGYSMGFDAVNSTGERTVSAGLGNVERVRAGMFESFPDKTRVVLDLKKPMTTVIQPLPDKSLFAIVLVQPGGSAPSIRKNPDPRPVGVNDVLRGRTIVVDAGHGGHDSGAPGKRSLEKTHTLDIARRLRRNLESKGATVLMTREGDYFISLQGRVDFANARRADLFFSVHIDSFKAASAGTTTHFWTTQSQMLAREVQTELARATGLKDRGLKQSRFFVVRKTWMPSVLTETCFISNPKEEALLLKPEWRERVAKGMAQGIANYFTRYNGR